MQIITFGIFSHATVTTFRTAVAAQGIGLQGNERTPSDNDFFMDTLHLLRVLVILMVVATLLAT